MSHEGKQRWTLILMREGQVNSRTLALSRGKAVAVGGVALVALATTFFVGGRWAGDRASRGRVEALEAEVLDLREENASMTVVAERVERLEAEYRQLRGVMGGDLGASRRDILLPPLSEEECNGAARDRRAGRGTFRVAGRGTGFRHEDIRRHHADSR